METPETPHAFALVGLPGSGKSTAAEHIEHLLETEYGESAVHTEVSDYVRTKFEAEHDDGVNDNELGRWATKMKEESGMGYFVREMAQLHAEDDGHTVISGMRSPEEADAVRSAFGPGNTTIISVWTLPDLRFRRKYDAKPSTEHDEWDTFVERTNREALDWGCVEFFTGKADYVAPNNATLEGFKSTVEGIVREEVGAGSKMADMFRAAPFRNDKPEEAVEFL